MKKSTTEIACLIILEIFLLILILPITPFSQGLYYRSSEFIFIAIIMTAMYLPIIIWQKYEKSKTIFNPENLPERIDPRFNVLYLELQQKHIAELEVLRKKTRISTVVGIIAAVIAAFGLYSNELKELAISSEMYTLLMGVTWGAMFVGFISLKITQKNKKIYNKVYKKKIVANFINSLKQEINYDPEDIMQSNEIERLYRMSGFECAPFNIFEADDHISGRLEEDIEIKIADISAKYETGSGRDKKTIVRFQGLYVVTNCASYFRTPIKIVKNGVPIMNKNKVVELDNDEFERYFDIHAEDKILAVRLLTHDVMECLLDFHKKYGIKYEIIIDDSLINIRFHTGPMFEPKIFGSSMDKELLYIYYLILKFVIDLTKNINKEIKNFEI